MIDLTQYLTEKLNTKTLDDVKLFLNTFKNDATSWRDATGEISEIAKITQELLQEIDGIKVDKINSRDLKTPSAWNTTYKQYILNNIEKMSKTTQTIFLNTISQYDWI